MGSKIAGPPTGIHLQPMDIAVAVAPKTTKMEPWEEETDQHLRNRCLVLSHSHMSAFDFSTVDLPNCAGYFAHGADLLPGHGG